MHNPPHPGETLLEDVLPALGLTVAEAARQLGISRVQLSRVLHGHSPVSPSLALRLEQWLSGATADVWLRMQVAHDLWQARHSLNQPKVAPAAAPGQFNCWLEFKHCSTSLQGCTGQPITDKIQPLARKSQPPEL